jgi:hypothetical protein
LIRAVVVSRTDGLGARLIAFGNGIRIARALGVPCHLAWNEADQVGGLDASRLFALDDLPPGITFARMPHILREIEAGRIAFDRAMRVIPRSILDGTEVLLCGHHWFQRFDDEPDTPALRQDFAAALRSIPPARAIAARIEAFAARHDLGPAVGVHVRRGDIVGHPSEIHRNRVVDLERYYAVLDAVATEARLFLCTEDPAVIEAFSARYPGRVFGFPTSSYDRQDGSAAEDAMTELTLLGETRFIVAGRSAFSRCAAARNARPLILLENKDSFERSLEIALATLTRSGLRG